uniref:Uncharacterized protein n=1 Tax=Anguilla anguilla TaxID=7936 RepID=A0A0E9TDM9_ANGAN
MIYILWVLAQKINN